MYCAESNGMLRSGNLVCTHIAQISCFSLSPLNIHKLDKQLEFDIAKVASGMSTTLEIPVEP